MKYLRNFESEASFDAAVMKLNKAWVTLTEDDKKAHFMELKSSAAWVGGGEADCVLGESEEFASESPVELYETKKLTAIKFPAEASELVSLETEDLKVVDLSECNTKSPIIKQVKEVVGDDVEVIIPSISTRWYNGDTLIKEIDVVGELSSTYKETACTRCEIGTNVTSIGNSAFQRCSSLTSVTIPDSVTSIGNQAFDSCSSLTSVTYNGVTYTSKSALTTALTSNGVTVGSNVFNYTKLSA